MALAVGARYRSRWRSLGDLGRRRVELKGLEENVAGPSGGEGGERGILNHRGQGQAHWTFRAWGSG